MAENRTQGESHAPESHWRVDTPLEQPTHAEIISITRAVEEALVVLGCEASDEDVQFRLRKEGIDIDRQRIARVRAELARSKQICQD
jgi:hypothetical protein